MKKNLKSSRKNTAEPAIEEEIFPEVEAFPEAEELQDKTEIPSEPLEELPEEILTEEEIARAVEEKPEELQEEILQEPAVKRKYSLKSQPHETEESTQREELKLEPEQQEAQVPTEEK